MALWEILLVHWSKHIGAAGIKPACSTISIFKKHYSTYWLNPVFYFILQQWFLQQWFLFLPTTAGIGSGMRVMERCPKTRQYSISDQTVVFLEERPVMFATIHLDHKLIMWENDLVSPFSFIFYTTYPLVVCVWAEAMRWDTHWTRLLQG